MSRQTLASEKFFRHCLEQFGDQFDYSETIYTAAKESVKVTCRKHNETFVVEARNHLRSKSGGCSECKKEESRLPLKDFIERASEIHGAKYDYSRVTYDNLNQKVTIICPLHNEFEQKAAHHLSGHECKKCGFTKRGKSRRAAVAEGIIERFKTIHGNKYDYSKVDYQRFHDPVTIICPIPGHGEFRQEPAVHLMGHGCQKCGGNPRLTQSEFLRIAHEVHGNRYDYSLVEVDGVDKPVEIICKKHRIFPQTPFSHLNNGANCPWCSPNAPKTAEEYIESFRATHGNKYDYSLVDY